MYLTLLLCSSPNNVDNLTKLVSKQSCVVGKSTAIERAKVLFKRTFGIWTPYRPNPMQIEPTEKCRPVTLTAARYNTSERMVAFTNKRYLSTLLTLVL